ncbi:MAG TPA: hypothetical protein VMB53_12835 [Gaiellaceae bacterium]|nr:hypothetical protein [Gaiellaceae bacterium]
MPEGLSASEVGKEIGEHAHHAGAVHPMDKRDRIITISEAVVLAAVAIIAAWSGFAAAKWSTESSLTLAKASATRTKANRAFQEALTFRVGDATTFNAWFGAYVSGNKNAERVAENRFRPAYRVAFDAWIATHPFTNPYAPPGPAYMPQYHPTGQKESVALDRQADAYYHDGETAAKNSDNYIRTTVILASVLFLVGISSHFPIRGVRIGLVSVGVALLLFAAVQIIILPPPP